MKPGIHWTEVASEIESAVRGCISPAEVDIIVDIVKKLIVENAFDGTVGIVTPFRQQTTRLIDALTPEIPLEIRDRVKLIIDTAHGFQGDERDVMIMSLCGGPTMPLGSLNFLRKDPNLMNVAVSRARAVLHIVGNKSWASNSGIRHIEKLTLPQRSPRGRYRPTKWHPHESPWEKKLFEALKNKGVEPEPQYPVLGRRLDLALVNKDKKIDIEVDGDRYHRNPDGTRKRDDVWRDIQMQGAEWKVMRFWVYQLRENMDNCVNKILKAWR
jgi:very-short-patch-repair endonuclease